MLNPCAAQKFIEIEICQDILVKEVTLANFEFFSSQFKEFSVYGSSKLPAEWVQLGKFTARNIRDRQHFTVQKPVIWTKFLRIEFFSHYGNEFYCPLTSIQVFGTSMLEEMKDLEKDLNPKDTAPPRETSSTINASSHISGFLTTFPSFPTSPARMFELDPPENLIGDEPSTTIPSYKQDSIFAKIIQRLNHLEKVITSLEENYSILHDFVNQTTQEQILFSTKLRDILSKHIQDQVKLAINIVGPDGIKNSIKSPRPNAIR